MFQKFDHTGLNASQDWMLVFPKFCNSSLLPVPSHDASKRPKVPEGHWLHLKVCPVIYPAGNMYFRGTRLCTQAKLRGYITAWLIVKLKVKRSCPAQTNSTERTTEDAVSIISPDNSVEVVVEYHIFFLPFFFPSPCPVRHLESITWIPIRTNIIQQERHLYPNRA